MAKKSATDPKTKRLNIDGKKWIVLPPKLTNLEVSLNCTDSKNLSNTEQGAWDKFCYPALKEEAYRRDGYKAYLVDIMVKVKI